MFWLWVLCLAPGACSILESQPLCTHPSCTEHLHLGASVPQVFQGFWRKGDWARETFFGPVGRDLEIYRGYASISPLAFEKDHLLGWVHPLRADGREREADTLRIFDDLTSGDSAQVVKRRMGPPDRLVRFQSSRGEVLEIWSWKGVEVALCLTRFLQFQPQGENYELADTTTLRGYVEGFYDFRWRKSTLPFFQDT